TSEDHDEDDHEKNERQRIDDLDRTHHQTIDTSTGVARDCTIGDTDGQGNERRKQANGKRNAASYEDPCEKIAAIGIGPEQKHHPLQWHVDLQAAAFVFGDRKSTRLN